MLWVSCPFPQVEALVDESQAASGAAHELVTDGGEVAFVGQMITESLTIGTRCT